MMMARVGVWLFSVGAMALGAGGVFGQNYPERPVRFVTSGVGGAGDFLCRLITPALSSSLGQPVIIDNRGGVSSPSQEVVAKSTPDGYTLLVSGASLWVEPLLQPKPYDAVRDFSPITLATKQPNVLVVHP